MAANKQPKIDFYQTVTDQIIEALEAGVKPWACPWDRTHDSGIPSNASTGSFYNGMNIMLLWMSAARNSFSSSSWVTAKQAIDLGGWIRKGEKGTRIFFYKMVKKRDSEDENDTYPMLKTFFVFNTDQVENVDFGKEQDFEPNENVKRLEHAEAFIDNTGANISYGGQKAFYRPSTDEIVIPEPSRFRSTADLYATICHELVHYTGHRSRLDRDIKGEFGSKDYAFEELVAELGSAFLMASLGIDGEVQHESYIANWLEALKNDKKFVFKASSLASKAHKYLTDFSEENEVKKVA
ncbi:ArdC family protein [Vibrio europaeus]|uniref:ArdC family protein n=1 Tax=Vibrio europaeus TaxID=300876 RepID=UPI00233E63BF|nr:zincin-like metallopeptidase domain-containing protein [Vibrio europaeus]MDC5711133.1 zincin-like metallopeptidase domain-containing protein [Vibrio europaeus]MDC5713162.1 zincin-like metallopeptidase domain-containing protein [Vibrio europaeus]